MDVFGSISFVINVHPRPEHQRYGLTYACFVVRPTSENRYIFVIWCRYHPLTICNLFHQWILSSYGFFDMRPIFEVVTTICTAISLNPIPKISVCYVLLTAVCSIATIVLSSSYAAGR